MKMPPTFEDRRRAALLGVFIGDALSMPVHWYYDPADIIRDFGRITTYQPPRPVHPTSIMDKSATGHGGRGDVGGDVIGRIILHGKKPFWGGPQGVHYHQGLPSGANTLNARCARLVLESVAANAGRYVAADFLERYVAFMTTPGSHDDTYAESFHRDFFANWARGLPPERCRGEPDSETPQVGGLVMPVTVLVALAHRGPGPALLAAREHLRLTHDSPALERALEVFAHTLAAALRGADLRTACDAAGSRLGIDLAATARRAGSDLAVVHRAFGPACYIEDSLPVVLHFARAYAGDFEGAVLANTNVGGENCHRGSCVGALAGAAAGLARIPARFIEGLAARTAIESEIDAVLAVTQAEEPGAA